MKIKKVKDVLRRFRSTLLSVSQYFGATVISRPERGIMLGVLLCIFLFGFAESSYARTSGFHAGLGGGMGLEEHEIDFTDDQIQKALIALLTMIEGAFGALVMVASGIGAIIGSAFGQYRAALGCLVVAVGSFILRSVMFMFFNLPDLQKSLG